MAEIKDTVIDIGIYPAKALQKATVNGEVPTSLEVGPTGPQVGDIYDREFVIYDPLNGWVVTQRGWDPNTQKEVFPQDKRLAAVAVDIRDDHITFAHPTAGQLELPTKPVEGESREAEIFGTNFYGFDQGVEAARYFSSPDLLERPTMLLRADRSRPRLVEEEFRREGALNIALGADGFPFLLASQASLDALHDKRGWPRNRVPLDRFRANINIDGYGLGAFGEDYLDPYLEFLIGQLGVWAVKPCARCPVPNIDQQTGELGEYRASSLLGTRVGIRLGGVKKKMQFAENLLHRWIKGQIVSLGDEVRISKLSDQSHIIFP